LPVPLLSHLLAEIRREKTMRRLLCLSLALALTAPPAFAFDLQGHRGARGLAPENTLPAFATALTLGVTTLELDINVTADGFVLVGHDPVLLPTVTRRADGTFLSEPGAVIRQTPLAELKRYDVGRLNPDHRYGKTFPEQQPVDGTRMPLLAEVFALAAKAGNKDVRFNIETKLSPLKPQDSGTPEELATALVAEIRKAGMAARASVQSFDWRSLKVVRQIAPELPLVMLSIESPTFDTLERGKPGPSPWLGGLDLDDFGGSVPKLVQAAGGRVWSPFWRNVTAENVAEAHALGLQVIPWTVNEPADMARLIDLKVDGIISDYPNRLRQVLRDKGVTLPAPSPVTP
jgi:glycerophosphoryl diester phosphodiesterase